MELSTDQDNEVEVWVSKKIFGGSRLSPNMIHGFAERVLQCNSSNSSLSLPQDFIFGFMNHHPDLLKCLRPKPP